MAFKISFPVSEAQVSDTETLPELKVAGPIQSYSFDAATDEGFQFVIPELEDVSGSMTITITWYADTATTGNTIWDAAALAYTVGTDTTDIEAATFATAVVSSASAASGTAQVPVTATITLTSGAQQDNAATGDYFILRIRRLGTNASDTMAGDAQVIGVTLDAA